MTVQDTTSTRRALLDVLMAKVEEENYPSSTMLDMIESLLTDDEMPRYVELLVERIHADRFPSIPLIQRVQSLT